MTKLAVPGYLCQKNDRST